MNKLLPLVLLSLLVASCSGYFDTTSKNMPYTHPKKHEHMTIDIKSIATAYLKSGTYGGSTQHEVFPTVYHYTHFDGYNSDKNEEFQSLFSTYIQTIKVNNSISLQEYLTYLYNNNSEKLQEIHRKDQEKRAVGNSHVELAKLFFVDDEAGTVLRMDPYLVSLSHNEHSSNLHLFLQENATHFKSEIPDAFFTKYYGN
ncbi:hypothetical protein U1E44_06390 [Arenibacter sp. GZD96]|uniref:hypothetical protein n=1 Tax=Aurantibrevibacter litoralis TaxID=3106030 RepID=UPI002AFE1144|nr:hypothetical protein [Arenibacter sp. GZD-96]MEA1785711.1 hypothetical protein [Arenibacter sp. GZD-96]